MILFGIYLLLTYIILLNLLVALISNTLDVIQEKRVRSKNSYSLKICFPLVDSKAEVPENSLLDVLHGIRQVQLALPLEPAGDAIREMDEKTIQI